MPLVLSSQINTGQRHLNKILSTVTRNSHWLGMFPTLLLIAQKLDIIKIWYCLVLLSHWDDNDYHFGDISSHKSFATKILNL